MFAHLLLARVKDKLLSVRWPEQCRFTPRSTVDRTALFNLNLLLQGRLEHSRPLLVAYVNLRAAFDSVDHSALWLSWYFAQVGRHVQGSLHRHSKLRAS